MKKHYDTVMCVKGGKLNNYASIICIGDSSDEKNISKVVEFIEGDFYAVGDANNNGLWLLTEDTEHDPVCVCVHNMGYDRLFAISNEDIQFMTF